MEAVYGGHDVFMWLPSVYGKSLCYQALSLIMDFKLELVALALVLLALLTGYLTLSVRYSIYA